MEAFLAKNYRFMAPGLILVIALLSYLIGVEEGKQMPQKSVVLQCSEAVLGSLAIPVSELAKGENFEPVAQVYISDQPSVLADQAVAAKGKYLGSKNGTKYYTPNCGGAKRIKVENYVWFDSEEDARLQGYTPANC